MAWIDRLDVEVVCGDIFSIPVEAVVVNTDVAISFRHTLGKELLARCGEQLLKDVQVLLEGLPNRQLALGHAVTTTAYNLGNIHGVILVAWWGRDNAFSPRLIEMGYTSSLRQAFQHQFASLALPLMGTGSRQMVSEDLYGGIVAVLHALDGLNSSHTFPTEKLFFVSTRSDRVEELSEYLDQYL